MDIIKKIIISTLLFIFVSSSAYPTQGLAIVVIKSRNIAPYNTALKGFKDYLDEQKVNARITEYNLEGKTEDSLLKLQEEIKSRQASLVLTLGTSATKFAQERIKDIPVVFTMVLGPERSDISVTGVSMDIPFEIKLKQLVNIQPNITRIGLIYSSRSSAIYEEVLQACQRLGLQLINKKINSEKEFPDALGDILGKVDYFLMVSDADIYFSKSVEYLLLEALRSKSPVVGLSSAYTKAGAMISFDCDYEDLGKQTGELALKLFAGEKQVKPEFIRPRTTRYSLNLLVAERLEIKIAPEIIKGAEEVFGNEN